ncbi:hypothetical protein T190_00540 [Sinorhizobium meliloti CCBAU 01290]|nr:hypothetical protein T190_00540 [Sinorhizobium meliloti CCBAU 01290]
MSMLEFKIQSDRIQSSAEASGDANAWAWLAVKVSAGFDSPPPTPTADDVSALVPWRWKPLITAISAGAASPIWNPHEVDSWVVWVIDAAGQVTSIDPSRIAVVSKDIDRNGLRTALDAASMVFRSIRMGQCGRRAYLSAQPTKIPIFRALCPGSLNGWRLSQTRCPVPVTFMSCRYRTNQ